MAQIPYNYISLELAREADSLLTESEFNGLKREEDDFIENLITTNKKKLNPIKQLNEMFFSRTLVISYLISLALAIVQIILAFVLIDPLQMIVLTGPAFFWLAWQTKRYLVGYFKTTAEIGHLEISIRHYYKSRLSSVKKSSDYNEYIARASRSH